MNLTLFFRLILTSIFQTSVISGKKTIFNEPMSYDTQYFYCPHVVAKDGFSVSLQIHHGNYCSSENSYRAFGHTMEDVEFGFPSMNEELMFEYSEMYGNTEYQYEDDGTVIEHPFDISTFDITGTVGKIPVSVLEKVFEKHGGIDWEKTISVETFERLTKS